MSTLTLQNRSSGSATLRYVSGFSSAAVIAGLGAVSSVATTFESPQTSSKVAMYWNYPVSAIGRDIPLVASRQKEFKALADWWHAETDHLSAPDDIVGHDAYKRIVEMGSAAVPLILDDLRQRGGDWYVALHKITKADPIKPAHYGRVPLMNADWFAWAEAHPYEP
jgi:hypothetical protein